MNQTTKGITGIAVAVLMLVGLYALYRAVQPPGEVKVFYVIDTRHQPMAGVEICVPDGWSGTVTDENGYAEMWWPDRLAKEPQLVEVRLEGYRAVKHLGRDVVRPEDCDYVVMIEKKPTKQTNPNLPSVLQ